MPVSNCNIFKIEQQVLDPCPKSSQQINFTSDLEANKAGTSETDSHTDI